MENLFDDPTEFDDQDADDRLEIGEMEVIQPNESFGSLTDYELCGQFAAKIDME